MEEETNREKEGEEKEESIWRRKTYSFGSAEKRRRKGKKMFGEGKYLFKRRRKAGKRKERKMRKVFRERKTYFLLQKKTAKEKEESIWRGDEKQIGKRRKMFEERKYFFCGGKEKQRRKRRKRFGEGK